MTLIDRYIQAVASQLPRAQRADVSQELRSSLLDQLEDRFGTHPTEDQMAEVLRELGPPEAMAASYQPQDRYLVSPAWFTTYRQVLGIVLAIQTGLLVAGFAFVIFFSPGSAPAGATLFGLIGLAIKAAVYAFTIITLIFFVLQVLNPRVPRTSKPWNPKDLPDMSPEQVAPRSEALASIAATAVFLALFHLFRNHIGLILIPSGKLLLNDVFLASLPWLSAAMLLSMGMQAWLLFQGRWHWYSRLTKLAIDLFGLAVLIGIARGVLAEKATLAAAGLPPVALLVITQLAIWVPVAAAVIILLENGWFLLRRLWRRERTPAGAAAVVAA